MQNEELQESYERDVEAARKVVSSLEARLASEKVAMTVVEARLRSVSDESKETRDKLFEVQTTATQLQHQVMACMLECDLRTGTVVACMGDIKMCIAQILGLPRSWNRPDLGIGKVESLQAIVL